MEKTSSDGAEVHRHLNSSVDSSFELAVPSETSPSHPADAAARPPASDSAGRTPSAHLLPSSVEEAPFHPLPPPSLEAQNCLIPSEDPPTSEQGSTSTTRCLPGCSTNSTHFSPGPLHHIPSILPSPCLVPDPALHTLAPSSPTQPPYSTNHPRTNDPCSASLDQEAVNAPPSCLLPGLSDDLAWAILLRVPCSCIGKMRRVCRGWRRSIPGHGDAFFRDRISTGLAEPWLYVSVSDWQGSNACFAWEPSTSLWHRLPPIPGSQCRNVLTLQFAAVSGRLLVSGMVERDNPMDGANGVFVYSPRANQWRRARPINTGRWFCMSGVVGGKLFVAGGIGTCNSLSLVPTVECYSVEDDAWEEMACNRRAELMTLPGYQAVLGGKLYAKNIGWGPRLGICYDPAAGEVEELTSAMVQGWQGPTAAVGDKLVIVDFGDGYKVKAWDVEKDKWQPLGTLRLPAEGHKPWAVQLVAFLGKLCLVLPNLTMVTIPLEAVMNESLRSNVVPETVEPKRGVSMLTHSGAEPSVLTSAVLGCQILPR